MREPHCSEGSLTEDAEADARALQIACTLHEEPADIVFQHRRVSRQPRSSMEAAKTKEEAEPPTAASSEPTREASPPVMPRSTKLWPYSLSSRVGLVDTHCHLDFIFRKVGHRGTYARFRNEHRDTFPDCYEGCVANFCDPHTFKQRHMWDAILTEDGVWGAFGCHPHMAREYSEEIDEDLIRALEHPKVVALGEIGLDYSRRNKCEHGQQKRVFRRQVQIALNGRLPLIIHSRDSTSDTIGILKEMVPSDYPIHRHCFTADWPEAQRWLMEFPNLCLGLTPLVSFPNAGGLVEVARKIPLDRLLIETDSPYFLPKSESNRLKTSHPGMAIHVATWLASLRNIEVEDVMTAVRENTRRIYNI
ncbi:3'-5' RNA nuclease TATDN2-like [Amblyomma americanum]